MYFLNLLKSFTDKSSTKYAFISYLANPHRAGGGIARHLGDPRTTSRAADRAGKLCRNMQMRLCAEASKFAETPRLKAVERWTVTTHREGDLHPPSITAAYLAVLALLYAGLSLQVVRLRWKFRVAFGDSGNDELRNAIRAHSHFAEYVPIIALMVAMLEIAGLPTMRVHLLMGALLIARLLHPFGMYDKPRTTRFQITRVGGMVITTIVMISAAALILGRLLSLG